MDFMRRTMESSPEFKEFVENTKQMSVSGMTLEQINALNDMFKKCCFTDDVTAEYNNFKQAFGFDSVEPDTPDVPDDTVLSISADYKGGAVPVGTPVSELKYSVSVKASYRGGLLSNIYDFTLSGVILEGENTITVSYGGKTTTFTVTGVVDTSEPTQLEPIVTGNCAIQTSAITEGSIPTSVVVKYDTARYCGVFELENGKTYEITGSATYNATYPYPPFVIIDNSWDRVLPTSGNINITDKTLYVPVIPSDHEKAYPMTAEYTATTDCYVIASDASNSVYKVIQK